ncbi:hypothetical protein ES708_26555 [subsurface metagenome]|jgi:hypothetical protein
MKNSESYLKYLINMLRNLPEERAHRRQCYWCQDLGYYADGMLTPSVGILPFLIAHLVARCEMRNIKIDKKKIH